MTTNRLNVIPAQSQPDQSAVEQYPANSRKTRARELQATFERLWLTDADHFNPLRNCMEQERLERTWGLLTKHVDLVNKQTADIGCAAGLFSRRLRDHGARVTGADIAENALKCFQRDGSDGIQLNRETMPDTSLPDDHFDLIICTELIAELPKEEYRLFFAELSRLIKTDGYVICSSGIDIASEGGVEKLIELAQTEFDILEEVVSYHALFIRLKHFLEAPSHYIAAWRNVDLKHKELTRRHGFAKGWYWLHTSPLLIWLSFILNPLTRPLVRFLKHNRRCLLFLERVCRFISDRDGISHYLFVAKRRPLPSFEPNDMPILKLGRKQIWE